MTTSETIPDNLGPTVKADWQFGLEYMGAAKAIIAAHTGCTPDDVTAASSEQDQAEAADLIVLEQVNGKTARTIGCRIRRWPAACDYRGDFTVRLSRSSNMPTELAKIRAGWMDWLFYAVAHASDTADHLAWWYLVDCDKFRELLADRAAQPPGWFTPLTNKDKRTRFGAFHVVLTPDILIAQGGEWP